MMLEIAGVGLCLLVQAACGAVVGAPEDAGAAGPAKPSAHVEEVAGAPHLVIDGKPTVPMVFMGIPVAGSRRVQVGSEWKRVQIEFVSPETAEGAPGFQIRVGGHGPGKVWIDDLRYYEGTPGHPVGPNMQPEGDFEHTGHKLPAGWALWQRTSAGVKASWAYDDHVAYSGKRSLRIDIEKGGTDFLAVHLLLTGCHVVEGHHYTVEVSLRADPERAIEMVPLHEAPPWTMYPIVGQKTVFTDQVSLAAKAGVHLQYPDVAMPWPKPGEKANYTTIDNIFSGIIAADPKARIIIRYGLEPPTWWMAKHPEAQNYCADGKSAQVWVGDQDWLRDACHWQEEMIRHLESRWPDRIVAYHPCGQHTGEWFYVGGWEGRVPCFGKGVDASFRQWLKSRYGTLAALSAAWARPVKAWDAVAAPTVEERRKGGLGQFLDPRSQRNVVDFFEFINQTMAQAIGHIAESVKRAAPNKACILFYGYLYELSGWPGGAASSGHYGWQWIINNPAVDIFCSPISYNDRQLGGVGKFMAPVDSVAAHGKLWFNEDDTRTFLTPEKGVGRAATLQQSQWIHQRNFTHIFPRRMGCWYMDLGATGWLDDARLWSNIARLRRLYQEHLTDPCHYRPEIAAVADERAAYYMPIGSVLPGSLLDGLRAPLYRVGAPVGWWLMEDLLAGKMPPAKLYVMEDPFVFDAAQRQKLVDLFRRQHATVVWFYAPGYLDPKTGPAGAEAMRELTGFRLSELTAPVKDVVAPVAGSPLCRGIADDFGSGREGLKPQFAVEPGPGVKPIATYPSGQIAAAETDAAGYRSIFVSSLAVPPELLRNIALQAGVHVYCDSNDVIEGSGPFLAISATSAGDKVLKFQHPSQVTDALTGRVVATGAVARFPLQLGQVRMMWVTAER